MKKVLLLTRNALKSNTSAGSTTHNIFSFYNNDDCASLYCRDELPDINMCSRFYYISEKELIHGFFDNKEVGLSFKYEDKELLNIPEAEERKKYDSMKKHRLYVFLWLRDLVWGLTSRKWNNTRLRAFLDDFSPEIIFMPIYDSLYMHRLLYKIKNYTNAKLLLYSGDDVYSYNFNRKSPAYYINQFILRRYIRKTITESSAVVCLSEIETLYLKSLFGDKVYQIYKSYNIPPEISYESKNGPVINVIYAGNLGYGRWKTLQMVGEAMDFVNENGTKYALKVYSATKLNDMQEKSIRKYKSISLLGEISYEKVKERQKESDLLLNIESFDKKEISSVRMSFSTKIVDYLFLGKCILSVGPIEVNSIGYLVNADVTLYADSVKQLIDVLLAIHDNKDIMRQYAHKAYTFGTKYHNEEVVNRKMKDILDSL